MKTIQEIANELGAFSADADTGTLKVAQALEDLQEVACGSMYSEVALCELSEIVDILIGIHEGTDDIDECVTRLQMLDCEYIIAPLEE